MNTMNRFRATGYHRTLFAFVLVLIYLFPVYWMIATSLKTSAALFATPRQLVPSPLIFTAYQVAVLNNPAILHAIFNSAIISSTAMIRAIAS